MNRRETVELFRERLSEVIRRSGMTRSAFAAKVGFDRSTLSQLLTPANDRLPRAETIAAIASMEQVSVDWLLGLSQEDQMGTNILPEALEIERSAQSPTDERLVRWQSEAAGYKIRYVPTTLPDLLKTQEIITYEFQERGEEVKETEIDKTEARLAYSRRPETDIEACSSFQSVSEFAKGQGVWEHLDAGARLRQLDHMINLVEELYPTFRWFLFDGLKRFAVPYTVFGPIRVALYFGDMYLVFNSTEHVRVLTRHFDALIRAAVIQPPDVVDFLNGLKRGL